MEEFENLAGFLEHISLVMDTDKSESGEAVSIMTLHSAKGLEFDTVFLPGWEEGLFPHQRTLDDQGKAGLEEERRLAHVGLTRARRRAKIYFSANRRMHGLWSSNIPRASSTSCRRRTSRWRRAGRLCGLRQHRRLALRRDDLISARATARPAGSAHRRAGADGSAAAASRKTQTRIQPTMTRRPVRQGLLPPRRGRPGRGVALLAAASRAHACRSPSRVSWSPNRPAPFPPSRSATACFTRNSARQRHRHRRQQAGGAVRQGRGETGGG